ncbi:PREDICTED: odorant receptor 4-like, partial [Dinoponera quadriceps]|uniref:Odorant receptor 4-like n=1 Tax=Dinoponera quadriceps TaxID=609295 RepID=A0A6P3XFD2_DINQU
MDDDWCVSMHVGQHLYLMTTKANISHFFSKTVFSFTTIAGLFYLLGDYALRFLHLAKDVNVSSRQFPLKVQFPFEHANESPTYELLFVIVFFHGMLNGYSIIILNLLILSMVLHASGQIDIICHEFKNISGDTPLYGSSASKIGMLIERHNRSVHGEAGIMLLVKAVFAGGVLMVEIFVFCFAGEYLSHKSKSIAEAAYDSLWYDMSPNYGKMVSFVIMRSQKQVTFTAGGLTNLSLETFAN